jgi:molybdopterin converting factor small subunit
MKLVRMKPGHGDVLLAEGDPDVSEDEERLIEEFRRQLDLGMWAAVPTAERGRRRATMVREFSEIPRDADRVVFFPPAAGG